MARDGRAFVLSAALVGVCALGGWVAAKAAADPNEVESGLKLFTSIYRTAEENAAERVDPDKAIFKGAIPGMLRVLDPHSSFFDTKDFAQLREDQRGHYYGVGMTIQPNREGRIVVVQPFTGTPAYKAGIRPGDFILEVNDKATQGLTSAQVADLLRGPKGTPVQIKVAREGVADPIVFNLTRGEIPRNSVETAFWIKPGIMYIDVQSFTETTSREVEQKFKELGEHNVRGLILDLRDNPGGLMQEGVLVAGRFLKRGQQVVSHRGRAVPEKPMSATNGSAARDYPIVVVVSRFSASAAEIVAGALQDHDRAWIIGDQTFGKGLVQTVFPMSENTGLALTTARYYTPSGRLVQRDYSSGSFFDYYANKDKAKNNADDARTTDSGRVVYGGNGIAPDEKVTFTYKPFQVDLIRRRAFFEFTYKYFGAHDTKIPNTWTADTAVMNEFHSFLLKNNVTFSEADFAEHQEWMKNEIKKEAWVTAFGRDEALKLAAETDPAIVKALEALPKAKELLEKSKKNIVYNTPGKDTEKRVAQH